MAVPCCVQANVLCSVVRLQSLHPLQAFEPHHLLAFCSSPTSQCPTATEFVLISNYIVSQLRFPEGEKNRKRCFMLAEDGQTNLLAVFPENG